MTIDEIRALIAQKIAGQGTMVDAGGGLPAILNALCDAIAAIPEPPAPYELPIASAETLGGVKIGDGLQISENGIASLKIPVITENLTNPVEVDGSRAVEIMTNSLVCYKFNGKIYSICHNKDVYEYIAQSEPTIVNASAFISANYEVDGNLDTFSGIVVACDDSDKWSIRYMEY